MDTQAHILIVDDEAHARDILEGYLVGENYHLVFAESGSQALAMLDEVDPDVILLDVMMPELDGFEVCQQLKADAHWRHLPIILVTALGGKEDIVRGIEAGGDDFLHKPVDQFELRARVRSMLRIKRQYDQLQATLKVRENLARMIAHDMRTPLNVILGYCELLQQNNDDPADLEKIQSIQTEGNRLNAFLNDMLALAKLEAGQPILHRSAVDVNHLVRAAIAGHSVIAQSRNVALSLDLPEQSRHIPLDANLFRRVLDNLLSNALKFSPAGSQLTVQVQFPEPTAASPTQVRVKVLDQGPGIPAAYRHRIFDKFEIANMKREGVSQVGFGLAFCQTVVEAHQGRIYVEPNQPQGSIFVVEI